MTSPQKLVFPPGLLATRRDEAIAVLCRLIIENHKKNGLLYKQVLHNHVQHGLLAAYCLDASGARLEQIFAEEIKELGPRKELEHGKIMTEAVIDELLGLRENEPNFVTYFEEQQSTPGLEVQKILQYWLLDREKPFLPGFIGGYGHPFILFADSMELGSSMLAFDALALTAVDWNPLVQLVTMSLPAPRIRPNSPIEIIDTIRTDPSFDNVVPHAGIEHITSILHHQPAADAILQYLSVGDSYLSRPEFNFGITEEVVEIAIHVLTCTHVSGVPAFDFYLSHNLTFVNCLRILLPAFGCMEAKRTLWRIYWLLTIFAFVTQGRPVIIPELLQTTNLTGQPAAWEQIKRTALDPEQTANSTRALDAHFLKAVQVMHALGSEMKDIEPLLLTAASKFVKEFNGWTGFGDSKLNIIITNQQKPK